ncbi:phosphate/phosphite/phosphonate ABC transporter substrate-binding protein [bacterium AH-315-I18]|nr:phosphate/phosphite/phosphonate ABC transporter substrate-binding protein [Phycisphaeraceae bacterium]MBN4061017.1 phosphate/phosphite/phosphonate ABC transporter substrate-binding protein [bacterium AH-315-I18]
MRALITLFSVLLLIVIGIVIYYGLSGEKGSFGNQFEQDKVLDDRGNKIEVASLKPLVLALIPERNIFAQRKRYEALAVELSRQISQPVELVSLNTYQSVLDELASKQIDGAFVGSMLAVLAYDRLGAQILVKPEHSDGVSTYHGVIFVRDDSPITQTHQLAGKSIAMVRTTTAAGLFPVYQFYNDGLLTDKHKRPRYRWVGTHDVVIQEVIAGTVDGGAVKDLRLKAYLDQHPKVKIRSLAVSQSVPDNGLIVGADMTESQAKQLKDVLLGMDQSPEGRKAMKAFGASRFLNCSIEEYQAVYQMVEVIGKAWDQLGVSGVPLKQAVSKVNRPAGSKK